MDHNENNSHIDHQLKFPLLDILNTDKKERKLGRAQEWFNFGLPYLCIRPEYYVMNVVKLF